MVAVGAGASACCLTFLGTNLASLQPSGYYQQIPTLALGSGALAVPALLEKAQLPCLACPGSSLPQLDTTPELDSKWASKEG